MGFAILLEYCWLRCLPGKGGILIRTLHPWKVKNRESGQNYTLDISNKVHYNLYLHYTFSSVVSQKTLIYSSSLFLVYLRPIANLTFSFNLHYTSCVQACEEIKKVHVLSLRRQAYRACIASRAAVCHPCN
jgi:hypothetical protein